MQLCNDISGFINYPGKKISYKFKGNIRAKVVSAIYQPDGKLQSRDRGSFTLMGNDRPTQEILKGFYSWMDDETQRPHSDSYVWIKDGAPSLEDRVELKDSSIHGKGVFAEEDFYIWEIIHFFEGVVVDSQSNYSLTFEGKHIEPNGILTSLNHSCSPNCDFDGRWLCAKEKISRGTELTIDYQAIEGKLNKEIKCECMATNCRGEIK